MADPDAAEGWALMPGGVYRDESGLLIGLVDGQDPPMIGVVRDRVGIALVPLSVLRALLSAHGLHIVTSEERQRMVQNELDAAKTKADRKVLEASGGLDQTTLEYWRDWGGDEDHDPLALYAEAELARRSGP